MLCKHVILGLTLLVLGLLGTLQVTPKHTLNEIKEDVTNVVKKVVDEISQNVAQNAADLLEQGGKQLQDLRDQDSEHPQWDNVFVLIPGLFMGTAEMATLLIHLYGLYKWDKIFLGNFLMTVFLGVLFLPQFGYFQKKPSGAHRSGSAPSDSVFLKYLRRKSPGLYRLHKRLLAYCFLFLSGLFVEYLIARRDPVSVPGQVLQRQLMMPFLTILKAPLNRYSDWLLTFSWVKNIFISGLHMNDHIFHHWIAYWSGVLSAILMIYLVRITYQNAIMIVGALFLFHLIW